MMPFNTICFIFTIVIVVSSTEGTSLAVVPDLDLHGASLPVSSQPQGRISWSQDEAYQSLLPRTLDSTPAISARSRIHCAVLCQTTTSCNSFFYHDVSRSCLLQSMVYVSPNDAVSAIGWRYFRLAAASCPRTANVSHDDYVIDRVSMTCYRVMTSRTLAWAAAVAACRENDVQLAVLDPVEKATFIYRFMNANKAYPRGSDYYYLIGGSRPKNMRGTPFPATGPDYIWLNGQPVKYIYTAPGWHTGRPNNVGNGESVMALRSGENFQWEDLQESWEKYYICERPLL